MKNFDPQKQRVFFALWPDETIAKQLIGWLPKDHPGKPVRLAQLHLTLAFIGDVDAKQYQQLISLAGNIDFQPFTLLIDRLVSTPRRQTIWAEIQKEPILDKLSINLRRSLLQKGFPVEKRPFKAHLTLARHAEPLLESKVSEPLNWSVDHWRLVASTLKPEGSHYCLCARWPQK